MSSSVSEADSITELFDSRQVREAGLRDLDIFAALVAPDVVEFKFPPFYRWFWKTAVDYLLQDPSEESFEKFLKLALGLPRGHAKTFLVKLLVVFVVLYTNRRYILVVGANVRKAEAIIADVCDMLDSYNVQEVFGNWRFQLETDRQDLKKFLFNGRPVILEAAGYGTAIRGSQQKNSRPDFIIFDDAQTKDCSESLSEAQRFHQWFIGTALKAKNPRRCMFIYVGNMYKDMELLPGSGVYTCMLRNLDLSSEWISFIVGGILADGTALWEELQPIEQLLSEFRQDTALGCQDIFFAEVLNDPKANTSYFLDINTIQRHNAMEEVAHEGNFIVIDPATSKATPDQQAIGYFEIHENVPVAKEVFTKKLTAPQTIQFVLDLALQKECSVIAVESNAYQYSLCEWFQYFISQLGVIGIQVVEINNSRNKNKRILDMFKSLSAGELKLSEETYPTCVAQAVSFDPRQKDNVDDLLDMLEMSLQVYKEFRYHIPIPGDLQLRDSLSYGMQGTPTQALQPTPSSF